jgi:hypothetical protein
MLIILGRREQLSLKRAKLVEKKPEEENLQNTDEANDDEDKKKKVPNRSLSLAEEADCLKKDQSTMRDITPMVHFTLSKQFSFSKDFIRDAFDSNRAISSIPFAIVFRMLYSIAITTCTCVL